MDTYGRISTPDLDKDRMQELIAQNEHLQFERNKNEKTIEDLGSVLDSERRRINGLEENVDRLIEYLMNLTESGDIEDHVAEELADIFGRTLTRTVMTRMTITLDAEVTVPVGYDLDDLHGDVDVEVNALYAADVEINAVEVSSIDVEV